MFGPALVTKHCHKGLLVTVYVDPPVTCEGSKGHLFFQPPDPIFPTSTYFFNPLTYFFNPLTYFFNTSTYLFNPSTSFFNL